MNLLNYQHGKMYKIYLNYPILIDILLTFIFFVIYNFLDYKYIELPQFIYSISTIPWLFIFGESEKIKRFKKSSKFINFVIIFIIYNFIFNYSIYILNSDNIKNIYLFNLIISIFTISFLRITFYSFFITKLWIKSKKR